MGLFLVTAKLGAEVPLWGRVGPQHGAGVLARLRPRTCGLMNTPVLPRAPPGGHPEKDKVVGLTGPNSFAFHAARRFAHVGAPCWPYGWYPGSDRSREPGW